MEKRVDSVGFLVWVMGGGGPDSGFGLGHVRFKMPEEHLGGAV